MKTEAPAYKRIVLKLSGEALQERGSRENISPAVVREIADRIKEVHSLGVQISIVIVIDQRGAGPHDFRQAELARRPGILPEVEPRLRRDVFQRRRSRALRRFTANCRNE